MTTENNLPPLPKHTGYMALDLAGGYTVTPVYTESQMRAYATQAVAERDAEIASLREANERFGKRQEWWTEKMFQLEQERDALKADATQAVAERDAEIKWLQTELAAAIKDRQMTEDATADEVHVLRAALEAQQEQCRINADGTTAYNWPVIEAAAAKWRPFETDWNACMAKLLLPLKPKGDEE